MVLSVGTRGQACAGEWDEMGWDGVGWVGLGWRAAKCDLMLTRRRVLRQYWQHEYGSVYEARGVLYSACCGLDLVSGLLRLSVEKLGGGREGGRGGISPKKKSAYICGNGVVCTGDGWRHVCWGGGQGRTQWWLRGAEGRGVMN